MDVYSDYKIMKHILRIQYIVRWENIIRYKLLEVDSALSNNDSRMPSLSGGRSIPKDHKKILNLFKQCVNNRGKDFSKKIKATLNSKGVIDNEGKLNTKFAKTIISSGATGD